MGIIEMSEQLKPCPFCGSNPIMQHHEPHRHSEWLVKAGMPEFSEGSFTAECPGCACGMIQSTQVELVTSWNRRADDKTIDQHRAEFEEWYLKVFAGGNWSFSMVKNEPGEYLEDRIIDSWEGWKAARGVKE